jgi:DNA-binding IclR family transcriptional regulator
MNQMTIPSVARAIRIIRMLQNHSQCTLQELTELSNIPKATLLRLLETLAQENIVIKDPSTKSYQAIATLVPTGNSNTISGILLTEALSRLSRALNETVEWYMPEQNVMILTMRQEPIDKEVYVHAKVGFMRTWGPEIEAVSTIGKAFFYEDQQSTTEFWKYDEKQSRKMLSQNEIDSLISKSKDKGNSYDKHVNPNGVKRYAHVVTLNGVPHGIISVAQFDPFERGMNSECIMQMLTEEANQLGS